MQNRASKESSPISAESNIVLGNLPYTWLGGVKENQIYSRNKVFITGHMEDKPGRANPRLTSKNIPLIRTALRQELEEFYTKTNGNIELVLCSGTTGTDLLATEWALEKIHDAESKGKRPDMGVDIYLPYAKEEFLDVAVSYTQNPEVWEDIFAEAEKYGFVHEPVKKGSKKPLSREEISQLNRNRQVAKDRLQYQPYVDLNTYMLSRLSPNDNVIAVWDGNDGDTEGGTQDGLSTFARAAQKAGRPFSDDQVRIINYGISGVNEEGYGIYSKYIVAPPQYTTAEEETLVKRRLTSEWLQKIDESKQRRILRKGTINILGK